MGGNGAAPAFRPLARPHPTPVADRPSTWCDEPRHLPVTCCRPFHPDHERRDVQGSRCESHGQLSLIIPSGVEGPRRECVLIPNPPECSRGAVMLLRSGSRAQDPRLRESHRRRSTIVHPDFVWGPLTSVRRAAFAQGRLAGARPHRRRMTDRDAVTPTARADPPSLSSRAGAASGASGDVSRDLCL